MTNPTRYTYSNIEKYVKTSDFHPLFINSYIFVLFFLASGVSNPFQQLDAIPKNVFSIKGDALMQITWLIVYLFGTFLIARSYKEVISAIKKNVFLIAIGTGTGSGLVINGDLYPGANNLSGEIGYMITDWSAEKNKRIKSFGNLES